MYHIQCCDSCMYYIHTVVYTGHVIFFTVDAVRPGTVTMLHCYTVIP